MLTERDWARQRGRECRFIEALEDADPAAGYDTFEEALAAKAALPELRLLIVEYNGRFYTGF